MNSVLRQQLIHWRSGTYLERSSNWRDEFLAELDAHAVEDRGVEVGDLDRGGGLDGLVIRLVVSCGGADDAALGQSAAADDASRN